MNSDTFKGKCKYCNKELIYIREEENLRPDICIECYRIILKAKMLKYQGRDVYIKIENNKLIIIEGIIE